MFVFTEMVFQSVIFIDGITYIWSAFVCSNAAASCLVSVSSFNDNRLFASSATRGWNSSDFFNGVPTDESDIGSSLNTKRSKNDA